MNSRLRMGMIGGGPGAFIGPVHRLAAELDREIVLVAGAFSSSPQRSLEAGDAYGLDIERAYSDLGTMIQKEKARDDGIQFVAIVTPNHLHFPAAKACLAAGVAIMTDKPLTSTLADAQELAGLVRTSDMPFGITYVYSGYPLVREARSRIADGQLGMIRKVVVEYSQGWLAREASGKQAAWRVDPTKAGLGGCVADIGVHAFHLAEFVTGLHVCELMADLDAVVPGRTLDDDCAVLLRFENGARGALLASQIEVGERNGLRIRVYGDKAGLSWRQEQPNSLVLNHEDGRTEILHAGSELLGLDAAARTRTPAGHPEGYLEAFANLYRDFAARLRGEAAPLLPGIDDGLRGMSFIATAVESSRDRAGWVPLTV